MPLRGDRAGVELGVRAMIVTPVRVSPAISARSIGAARASGAGATDAR
jgi:hypothetical protein